MAILKKKIFPKFLGPIPRSGRILALQTTKNNQKNFFAHILCLHDIWYQKTFWPP